MTNTEYYAKFRMEIEDQADLKKINQVRFRFDSRMPRNFGVFDQLRGQYYWLQGFESEMLKKIALKKINTAGQIIEISEIWPTGLSAGFIFSPIQFRQAIIRVITEPKIYLTEAFPRTINTDQMSPEV